jgi:hypothetical protein
MVFICEEMMGFIHEEKIMRFVREKTIMGFILEEKIMRFIREKIWDL